MHTKQPPLAKMVEIGARLGANRSEVVHLARIRNAAWRRFSAIFNNELLTHHTSYRTAVHACAAGGSTPMTRHSENPAVSGQRHASAPNSVCTR